MFPKGTGWREEGRLPASSPVGKRQEQEGPEGGADVCRKRIYFGEGSEVQGQLGNNKGWEKPGDRGDKRQLSTRKGRREGVAGGGGSPQGGVVLVKEARWVVVAPYLCTSFHCFHSILTYIIIPGSFLRLPILLKNKIIR